MSLMHYESNHAQVAALIEQEEFIEAAEACRGLLRCNPSDAHTWSMLGVALRKLGHLDEALPCARRAAELSPNNYYCLTNYGNMLVAQDKHEAIDVHARAFRLAPDDFLVRTNFAVALRDFGYLEEAQKHFELLHTQKPDDVETAWNYAENNLRLGHFKEGWEMYEVRMKRGNKKLPSYSAPRWQGENFNGKTLLVYEEQGFGDTILSSRYLPLVKARGGRVLFGCRPALHRLFDGLVGVDRIVGAGALGETFQYHVPVMSLPGIFGTDLNSIPPPPELHFSPSPSDAAKELLVAKGHFKVGIVWSGNPGFRGNRRRSTSLEHFLPLSEISGVQIYSLQKNLSKNEGKLVQDSAILELGPYLNDFADTAAVVSNLDLVIMHDSAVVHLAGSIGKPVWNLLPCSAYWLYLTERDDSPWYPSLRLFRQPKPGDWDSVFRKVTEELINVASAAKGLSQPDRYR